MLQNYGRQINTQQLTNDFEEEFFNIKVRH